MIRLVPPLTQKEYVALRGIRCPACGTDSIEGNRVDIDGGTATQNIFCRECNAGWTDVYSLTGYEDLEVPDEIET